MLNTTLDMISLLKFDYTTRLVNWTAALIILLLVLLSGGGCVYYFLLVGVYHYVCKTNCFVVFDSFGKQFSLINIRCRCQ